MPPKDKYTDPELRDQVKEEIQEGDKGGQPGQWSARKAQMMAKEYKNRGGGYTTDKDQKDESQKHLDNWTEEEWQTKEGSGNAKQEDGTEKRYLPKQAWEKMSKQEKEETDQKKQEESKEGKQYVSNTDKAKESRKHAAEDNDGKNGSNKSNDGQSNSQKQSQDKTPKKKQSNPKKGEKNDDDNGNQADKNGTDPSGEEDYVDDAEASVDINSNESAEDSEAGAASSDSNMDEDQENDANAGEKRKHKQAPPNETSNKKQKNNNNDNNNNSTDNSKNKSHNTSEDGTVGSKHMKDEAPAQQGSASRLPEAGQDAHWKALPGFVDGKVVEVLTEGKKVDGKEVKASGKEPKIVLKSNSSGKVCVHKPEACYYD